MLAKNTWMNDVISVKSDNETKCTCKLRSVQHSEERMHLTQYNSHWQTLISVNNCAIHDSATIPFKIFWVGIFTLHPSKGPYCSNSWVDAFAELLIKNTLDDLKQLESDLELRCVSHSTKRNSLHGLPRGQVRLFLMAKGQQQFLAKPYLDNGIYHQRVF